MDHTITRIKPRTEVLERYCPHIRENVVLLRRIGGEETVFTCLRAEVCPKRSKVRCIDGRARAEEGTG